MERKRAMAVAATVTCVLGSSAVALAATAGVPVLGFGRSQAADAAEVSTVWRTPTAPQARRVVTRTKDVFDKVVVDVPEGGPASVTPPPTPATAVRPGAVPTTSGERSERNRVAPRADDDDAPVTTGPPTVTEPHEPHESADQPVPPMPPDCREPHLEDNGVWNCQGD